MINDHRRFLYQDGIETGRIFEEGEEIPEGWTDLPDSDGWDNPPEGYVPSDVETVTVDDIDLENKYREPEKYPSQMNKTELVDFGLSLGLDLDMSMGKRDMLDQINLAMMTEEKSENTEN